VEFLVIYLVLGDFKMSTIPSMLLAKSKPELALEQHLFDTERAAKLIFRLDGRWGQNWCRFFKIHEEIEREKFLLNLRVAGLFHDIGKANKDFYDAVKSPGFKSQTIRHEHLSALVLCLPEVRSWLSTNTTLDINLITAAVLSHHLKASASQISVKGDPESSDRIRSYRWCQPNSVADEPSVELYFQHDEVTATLEKIAEIANLGKIPKLPNEPWKAKASTWRKAYHFGKDAADDCEDRCRDDESYRLFLCAVKAGLIVADSVASGLFRTQNYLDIWIEDVVHSKAISDSDIAKAILLPRAKQIEERTGEPFKLHGFQEKMAERSSRSLLLAACSAGKTLGAWVWAEARVKQYNIGKVIFLYPTRGTATEGFRDYVAWAPEMDAALMTGTARYELEQMRENPSDSTKGKDFQADERLYSLGFWSRRYFSATIDQFLGFMEHSYASMCLLPVLADSAVIIDEIHSFDRSMFKNLISFLKHFDIPVLCMTATLPPARKKQLVEAGLQVFPEEDDRDLLQDLKKKEEHPRYKLEVADRFRTAFDRAVEAYRDGERVLWVVNTVDRCIAIAEMLECELQTTVLTYHSRFRLKDRQKVHRETVAAFAYEKKIENRQPAIAVTTQVCEMSLDLDADVLITEIAPVPSLVQRFGRANRHLARGEDFLAKIYLYSPPPNSIKPYTKAELEISKQFIAELVTTQKSRDRATSQYDLAIALEKYSIEEKIHDSNARFLDSGYYAIPGSFRESDDFSVPCILDEDIDTLKSIWKTPDKYKKDELFINVPRKFATFETAHHTWLPKYLGVAPKADYYNPDRGFKTRSLEEEDLG
jgi:CRISPR-associated endonuclease/helicase Cas3